MEFWLAIAFAIMGGALIGSFLSSAYFTYFHPNEEDDFWDEDD
jgi:hypothetical protein